MDKVAKFVGLDVHKDTIAIAWESGGPLEVAASLGQIAHDLPRLLRKLKPLGQPADVRVAYEAGPTGYGLQRALQTAGYECIVVAPSKTPMKRGERVKTDRRDASKLAHYLRTNSLTPVAIPTIEQEALRDLQRAREDAMRALRTARQQLLSFLLRQGRTWSEGKSYWTLKHRAWIQSQRFESEAHHTVLADGYREVVRLEAREADLKAQIEEQSLKLPEKDLFLALQALRGVGLIVSSTLVSELGDLRRFKSPGRLMSFVGLVPSERSSGDRVHKGPITKAGNTHVRRVLVEAAWSGRHRPEISVTLKRRSQGLPPTVLDIAWKAQKRLFKRFQTMRGRNKEMNKIVVALARELCGFVWAIGQEVSKPKSA